MIKIENLNKYYQSGQEKIHALKNINLTFPDKGLIFILGPSGCGKSTLLNLLGGLDKPTDGEIYIEDRKLSTFTNKELNNYLNSYLGFVFQEYNILKDLNLFENISLPLEMQNFSRRNIKKKVTNIIKEVELDSLEKRKVNQLSGGQRQRVAIARALIKNPKMIIADEPTGNLDSETGATIFSLFKKLAKDRLIIIVTHDDEAAFHYGDRVIQINDGIIVEDTNPNLVSFLSKKLVIKKAKVPIKTSIKLSLKNIHKKKIRFLLMTFISALSLAFLSFTIELKGDKLRQNIYTTVNNQYNYVDILARAEPEKNFITGDFYDQYRGIFLPLNSYDKLKKLNPNLNIHQYQYVGIDIAKDNYKIARTYYPGTINTIVLFDEHNNYQLWAGRLPINGQKEVMVTDYLIDHLIYYNLLPDNLLYYDYLGRLIKSSTEDYKIVGILKTKHEYWRHFFREGSFQETDKRNYAFYNDFLIMNSLVLPLDEFEKEKNSAPILINTGFYKLNVSLNDFVNDYEMPDISLTDKDIPIIKLYDRWGNPFIMGRKPNSPNEIVIPYTLGELLTGESVNISNLYSTLNLWYLVKNKSITINITKEGHNEPFSQTFTIVGMSSEFTYQLDHQNYVDTSHFIISGSENLLAELPKDSSIAFQLFQNAYQNGYLLDVWSYKNDIDAYTIDPFIELISKAGLFVFAIFSIGILWTIITIEIVDSKKEIGIFRSFGLSGFRVSFIFIFQTLVISIVAYFLAILGANYAIKVFNRQVMDELNMVNLSMYMMTSRSPIYLFIFLSVITFISIIIPLTKIMSQKIIDVINERDNL